MNNEETTLSANQPSRFLVRLFCGLYDLLFVTACLIISGFILFGIMLGLGFSEPTIQNSQSLIQLYYFFWLAVYFIGFWQFGKTPAMRIWRLSFVHSSQQPIPLYKHGLRFLLNGLGLGLIGLPLCLIRKDKKTLVDLITKVSIYRSKKT